MIETRLHAALHHDAGTESRALVLASSGWDSDPSLQVGHGTAPWKTRHAVQSPRQLPSSAPTSSLPLSARSRETFRSVSDSESEPCRGLRGDPFQNPTQDLHGHVHPPDHHPMHPSVESFGRLCVVGLDLEVISTRHAAGSAWRCRGYPIQEQGPCAIASAPAEQHASASVDLR
eukprot:2986852-Rhodomonas_salina.2